MELNRFLQIYNKAALRSVGLLVAVAIANGFISQNVRGSFDLIDYLFTSALPFWCIALGVIVSAAGANYLGRAVLKGKLK